jgi:glycerol uptake facilitator-like aquaporin
MAALTLRPLTSVSISTGAETSSQSQASFWWYWWWPLMAPVSTSSAMALVVYRLSPLRPSVGHGAGLPVPQ